MAEIKTLDVHGFDAAIHGMRMPYKSLARADTVNGILGPNDEKLAKILLSSKHDCDAKFSRMIMVWADFTMPRYFWEEFSQYHFTVTNSESTMHTLMGKEEITPLHFELPDYVYEIFKPKEKIDYTHEFICNIPDGDELRCKHFTFNGLKYTIWNDGRLYSDEQTFPMDTIGRRRHFPERLLKFDQNPSGYYTARIGGRNGGKLYLIHRILAEQFIENPNPKEFNVVNHIDGNKWNCSLDNLEWTTSSDNNKKAFEIGLKEVTPYARYIAYKSGRKFDEKTRREIRQRVEDGELQTDLMNEYCVSMSCIQDIVHNKSNSEHADDFKYAMMIEDICKVLNKFREEYCIAKESKNIDEMNKLLRYTKSLLPESFLQTRTVCTNYQELRNMYRQRKNHRLAEWNTVFVNWVHTLPYSWMITGEDE